MVIAVSGALINRFGVSEGTEINQYALDTPALTASLSGVALAMEPLGSSTGQRINARAVFNPSNGSGRIQLFRLLRRRSNHSF